MRVALAGSPNSGKSSLFNLLTGLSSRTGNFPGVTVDRTSAVLTDGFSEPLELVDLPGLYSLTPRSAEELVSCNILCDRSHPDQPDAVLVVADASSLKRSLILLSQIMDLGHRVLVCFTMCDLLRRRGSDLDIEAISRAFGVPCVGVNPLTGEGKQHILRLMQDNAFMPSVASLQESEFKTKTDAYRSKVLEQIAAWPEQVFLKEQTAEAIERNKKVSAQLPSFYKSIKQGSSSKVQDRADRILLHPLWGTLVFSLIMFLLFQSVYTFAEWPMNAIESGMHLLVETLTSHMPEGVFTDLVCEGILPGIGGVLVFIPQIAFLFLFVLMLEDTGYMARVSFLLDRFMRRLGLNGKSLLPILSGVACAVPSIMGTRTISNTKERLITIFILPLISCSARLPVYTLLIALVVPDTSVAGIFSLRGLMLFSLYMLGFGAAFATALLLKYCLKNNERSFLLLEMPEYRKPRWQQLLSGTFNKVKIFISDAGKVILAVAVMLWFLSSYSPSGKGVALLIPHKTENLPESYIGILGKKLEPVIRPMGFDWKIGVSLITSFAAREVFVGSMATLYSLDENAEEGRLREKISASVFPETGAPVFTARTSLGLILFYAFALQCMSTIAVVWRESGSLKFALAQLLFLSALACFAAWLVQVI